MTNLREAVARAVADQLFDGFDNAFLTKSEWNAARGEKAGRVRDINEPMQDDYLAAADAALAAIEAAGFTVVPREATEDMVEAGMAARQMPGQASGVFGQTLASSWRHEFRHELRTWAAMLDAAPKP